MTKVPQKSTSEFLKDSSKEQKTAKWQMDYAEYIDLSNKLADENDSALDQWRTF